MDNNDILKYLNNLHSKIVRSSFAKNVTKNEIIDLIECNKRTKPVKPKKRYKTRYMWDAAYCPTCDCGITARWNFCQNCGKSIDWNG